MLAWAWRSRTPWREIGYVRPRRWLRIVVIGLFLGSVFKLLMKAIVMPLLGAPAINPAYHYLSGNRAALPGIVLPVIVGAGFGEVTGHARERETTPAGPEAGAVAKPRIRGQSPSAEDFM